MGLMNNPNAWCCIVISRKICLMRWLTSPCASFFISSLLRCSYVLHISLWCMCTKAAIRLLLLCSLQTPFGMLDQWKFSSSNITHLSRLGSSMIRWSKFQKAIGCVADAGVGVRSNICKHYTKYSPYTGWRKKGRQGHCAYISVRKGQRFCTVPFTKITNEVLDWV